MVDSNHFVYIVTICVILITAYMMYRSSHVEVTYVKSKVDNKEYLESLCIFLTIDK